jgi:hypothetical protein
MLEVQVINDVCVASSVQAGQVRKSKYPKYYALVVCKGEGDEVFNAIKLTDGDGSSIRNFETVYHGWVKTEIIERDFPIVVDAKLTITDKEDD